MPLTARYAAAQQVALKAGELARDPFAKRDPLIVEHKGAQNFVSRADRAIEDFIASKLAAAFPGDAFLGEESAASFAGAPEHVWVVDPIDGTHNFLRGLRYYCVSIAYVEVGKTELGVVYDPEHDEMFHARRGEGAWRRHAGDQGRIAVSECATLKEALIAVGHHDRFPEPRYLALRHALMDAGAATRNLGAGALQLAHVASGRLDGFVELSLNAWDALAGLLLVEEAGGHVAPFPGPERWRDPAPVLGCAPRIAGALQSMVGAW
jgi:myo-inositol-1(or 4)-monophosphatase